MGKREQRNKIKISPEEMLKPLDIEKFGSDTDPCFGKLYNLNTPECKRCGDSEICGAVFAQGLHKIRGKIEKNNRFKDLELDNSSKLMTKYINRLKAKGYKQSRIIRLTKKKFNISRVDALKLIEND